MMRKKNIVAIVPARGGSKSIPYKNLKKIQNKPLIYFILKTLLFFDLMIESISPKQST